MLLKFGQLRSLPTASARNVTSVSNWLYNNGDPVADEEVLYLKNRGDLVPVLPKSKSSLRLLLEKFEGFRLFSHWRLDRPDVGRLDCADYEHVFYTSDDKMERFIAIIILVLGLVMIIASLWILNAIKAAETRLGVITMFIVLFVCLLSFTTVAKPFESLAGAAA